MVVGDTFKAAASDQLEIWTERIGCEIVVAEKDKAKASSGKQLNYNSTMNLFYILFPLFLSVKVLFVMLYLLIHDIKVLS